MWESKRIGAALAILATYGTTEKSYPPEKQELPHRPLSWCPRHLSKGENGFSVKGAIVDLGEGLCSVV